MRAGATATEESFLALDPTLERFAAAHEALRARRRDQRGVFTYGDDCDAALVAALADLDRAASPVDARKIVQAGEEIGRHVYARRMFEDSFLGALIVLSASLFASGVAALEVVDSLHRVARVRLRVLPPLAGGTDGAASTYVRGVAAGFMSEAFNCAADVRAIAADEMEVRLGEGRDANRRRL